MPSQAPSVAEINPLHVIVDILQSPCHSCPIYDCKQYSPDAESTTTTNGLQRLMSISSPPSSPHRSTVSSPPSSPPLFTVDKETRMHRQRTIETRSLMHNRLVPYKCQVTPHPIERHFTMRCLGRSSHTELEFKDVVEVSSSPHALSSNELAIGQATVRMWFITSL